MNSAMAKSILVVILVVAALGAGIWIGRRPPQREAENPAATGTAEPPASLLAQPPTYAAPARDPYQRSLAIYEFKKAAASGPDRGREIFYYKCWFCHNEYAGPSSAPSLVGVFKRGKLLSGRPATEAGIKDEIRNGGAGMAAYQYTLTDADLDDLVAYLRDACCWDSNSPPPNPRYVAGRN